MRFTLLLFIITIGLYGQSEKTFALVPGIKIGSPVRSSGSQSIYGSTADGRWTGGPSLELRLPFHLSVEADALFRTRRINTSYPLQVSADASPYLYSSFAKSNICDFPLLLKYRFTVLGLHPFVSGGYQWSRSASEYTFFTQCMGATGSCLPSGYTGPEPRGGFSRYAVVRGGAAGGAGLDFKTRYVTIAPEARCHHNGVTALVGFTFGGKQ